MTSSLLENPVFVVNSRSGGGVGARLAAELERLGHAERLIDVINGDLESGVASCCEEASAFVACGGDGTVAGVIETVQAVAKQAAAPMPPIGVLPLGTGNDLARALLGSIPSRPWEDPGAWLARLGRAKVREWDRWVLEFGDQRRSCFNYCSFGADAAVAQKFDTMRQHHPQLFRGSLPNKGLYGILGMTQGLGQPAIRVAEVHRLPKDLKTLVLANIASYAGGGHLPGVRPDDGCVDVFAFGGPASLFLGTRGLRRPRSLGQHKGLHIQLDRPVVAQVDGEAFRAPPGRYRLRHGGQVRLLAEGGTHSVSTDG